MSGSVGKALRRLFKDLARDSGETISETVDVCRVDGVKCASEAMLARIREAAIGVDAGGFGSLVVFGQIAGKLDIATASFDDVSAGKLDLRFEKAVREGWYCFVTVEGLGVALDEDLITIPATVAVAERFAPFASVAMSVTTWEGAPVPPALVAGKEAPRPRKFIRDLTGGLVPKSVEPWLLTAPPKTGSPVFAIWSEVAARQLANALPAELREVESEVKVVLKGPRSAPIDLTVAPAGWGPKAIQVLSDAAAWVYSDEPKSAETRFLFLNNHLSLAWRDGHRWPEGLLPVLGEALISAREAYSFHIEGETKDALKSLGDLRKSIQEDVSKAQGATRDLIAALWRDFAIAGIVLAFRSPVAQQATGASEGLRYVAPATAVLLLLSLLVTVTSNFCFDILAKWTREDWRRKIYPFVSDQEWKRLVRRPIARTRWVYRLTLPFVGAFYGVAIWYLYTITDPAILAEAQAIYERIRAWTGW